jgi:hypothetical protein
MLTEIYALMLPMQLLQVLKMLEEYQNKLRDKIWTAKSFVTENKCLQIVCPARNLYTWSIFYGLSTLAHFYDTQKK